MEDLGELVKKDQRAELAKKAGSGAGIVRKIYHGLAPIFEKEDLDYHVDSLLKEHKDVKRAVADNPYLRRDVQRYMEQTIQEYKWAIYGAKTVDSIDAVATAIELGAGLLGPQAEAGVKVVTEPIEWMTKIPYVTYYAVKSGDWFSPVYFTAAEALSLVPYAGAIVDFKHIYLNRLRKRMRKKAAEGFLENIIKKQVKLAGR
ncbi:hypothetical protein COV16_05205 [Candidatus Woesearchaeota archaeon CG10_big_fil_rev_8_21_14_0_10_34_8]|nr:MAG: hypothetical protein COV16_05205 [Candidatus Woesearchaeota archaeon CG10_big_fil_rev_8_21_14_0_10_34_8]